MDKCKECDGAGLIGAGPNPHALEGAVRTCERCGGTGSVASTEAEPVPELVAEPAPEPAEADPKAEGGDGSAGQETSSPESSEASTPTDPVDNASVPEEGATV